MGFEQRARVEFSDGAMATARFSSHQLMAEHPPVWQNRNKQAVFEIACPPGRRHEGEISYSRWQAMPLPGVTTPAAAVGRLERRETVFEYRPALPEAGGLEWHVNFADPDLFVAYGSGLFAQDEMQVTEHPVLGALKEALRARRLSTRTEENGGPTPILVTGARRYCTVANDRNAAEGRPDGLYGNTFRAASTESVIRATTRIDPPTVTNLIAIAAPSGGHGEYEATEIERILTTAFTGFRAAVHLGGGVATAVHTGFWGCGAFGGNRELMALLQMLAAEMAGVDRLVFHTVRPAGTAVLQSAARRLEVELGAAPLSTRDVVQRVTAMGFVWGVSDGN